jgi:hypothetical protein
MGSLIATNPATQGMADMANVQGATIGNNLARMQFEELRRTRDVEHQIDSALRQMILQEGGLGQTGGDVGAAQPVAPLAEGGFAGASPQPTAPRAGGSLQNVPVPQMSPAPGPQATMGRGDAPGFQSMLANVLPPEANGQQAGRGMPLAPAGPTPNQNPQLGLATPEMSQTAKMVPLQNPPMPGTVETPPAARTMGLDRQMLARRLAQIEGGGTAAYELLREQEELDTADATAARESHDKAVTNFFKSIEAGDVYSAQYWSAQAGMEIPDEMYSDAEAMRVLGIAGKYKTFYGADVESFGRFLGDAFNRVGAGDPKAFENAFSLNRPKRVASSRIVSPQNQAYAALLQKHNGDAVAAYREWKTIGGGAGSGQQTTIQRREELALKFFPDDPIRQADFINGGRPPTRTEIRKLAVDELKARYGSTPPRGEDWDRELTETIREYETLAYQHIIPPDEGSGGEPEIDFATQGRIPTAEDNQATYTMPDGSDVYTNDGTTWYDDAGNKVYGGTGN